jgi:hypothetical protein
LTSSYLTGPIGKKETLEVESLAVLWELEWWDWTGEDLTVGRFEFVAELRGLWAEESFLLPNKKSNIAQVNIYLNKFYKRCLV